MFFVVRRGHSVYFDETPQRWCLLYKYRPENRSMSTLFWRFSEFTVIDKFALFLFDIVRLNFHWKFHLYFGLSLWNNILRGRCIYWFFHSDFSFWVPSLWVWRCSWIFCRGRNLMGPGCRTGWSWWVVSETFRSTFWPSFFCAWRLWGGSGSAPRVGVPFLALIWQGFGILLSFRKGRNPRII